MKIGIFSIVAPEYSPEEIIPIIKSIGYDGIEWRVGDVPSLVKPEGYNNENRYWTFNRCTLDVKEIDR